MQRSAEYLTVAGLFLLMAVLVLLLSSPEDIFSSLVVIDVSKTHKTGYEMLVTTLFDFKKREELSSLPKEIANMSARDIDITASEAKMGALVKRMYSRGNESVLFMLLSSQNMSEFHDLTICYGGSWNITENRVMEIQAQRLGEAGYSSIHVNRFIVQRGNLEMVVLYWFMWDGGIVRTDKNFMLIQVATPVEGDREKAVALTSEYTREFFLRMYKPVAKSHVIGQQMADSYGILGYGIDALALLVPLLMIFNSKIQRR